MKTIFRFFSISIFSVVVAAGSVATSYGQTTPPEQCADVDGFNALYTTFTASIGTDQKTGKSVFLPKTVAEKQAALDGAKQLLERYGSCTAFADNVKYVSSWVPIIETSIKKQTEGEANKALFGRFDAGIKGEKYDEAYAAGKEILAKQPDNLNIIVPLGVIGLYQSYNKNFKYNDDTLRYAQQALSQINSGKEFTKKDDKGVPVVGVFQFTYNKEDAISELNYAIGYINYYGKNDKKAALPYYYTVSQKGKYKSEPRVFATIGSYYLDEASRLGKEIAALIEKQKAAATDPEKAALDTEIKAKIALFNGYAERSLDAYSRAYTVAKSDTAADKTYKDGVYKTLQEVYKLRFNKTDGLDTFVATTVKKPLPDPMSEVTPVSDPEPAKTTGSTDLPTAEPAAVKKSSVAKKNR